MTPRLARRLGERELPLALAATVLTAGLAYLGASKGVAGLLLPLLLLGLGLMMMRPAAMVTMVTALVILCEGEQFGLFASITAKLYDGKYFHEVSPLDVLVALTLVSVGMGLKRERRRLRVPFVLVLSQSLLAVAMLAGAATGKGAGNSVRSEILAENVLLYLLLLPIAVANLKLDREQVTRLIGAGVALAVVKSVLGLLEVLGHHGVAVEGRTILTYYEPTANWTVMCALFGLLALALARVRPPRWTIACAPLLLACLLLSYRRSFWIATVLGVLLLALLASSATGRRFFIPAGLMVALAVWALGSSANLQNSSSPIVQRLASLNPSKLEANAEDRYRLDERANVLGAIEEHPITGLGLLVPWSASFRPLPVEHEDGREYVHFAALWFWLKLGILGLFAYIGVLLAGITLAVRVWRTASEPVIRAFGVASLAAIVGLAVMDTTASFTGVEPRFTVVLGVQLGLLALLAGVGSPDGAQAPSDIRASAAVV